MSSFLPTQLKPTEMLPSLSYSILTENALRKKIAAQGIPSSGPKQLLIRRHTEWVNLWNSNCDSLRPRTKKQLLLDLDTWERTQGGHATIVPGVLRTANSIMAKDFDGAAWSAQHDDDFERLISEAREKRTIPSKTQNEVGTVQQVPPTNIQELDSGEATTTNND